MTDYSIFPALNATLNGASAVLITTGRVLIARKKIRLHRACMITAVATSSVFLVCYLYYHAHVGSVHFPGQGWVRPVYFTILISHTVLAAAVVPLVLLSPTGCGRDLTVIAKFHAGLFRYGFTSRLRAWSSI